MDPRGEGEGAVRSPRSPVGPGERRAGLVGASAVVLVLGLITATVALGRGDGDGPRPAATTTTPATTIAGRGAAPDVRSEAPAATWPEPPRGWPGPGTTGVPAGTELRDYTGPCTITEDGTVIEARTVSCNLSIQARDVVIRRSLVLGAVHTDDGGRFSVTLEDTSVDAGVQQLAAVAYTNLTLIRADVQGGQASVNCVLRCTIRDSWLHGQRMPAGADWHLDAFLMNGGSDAQLVGNTLDCQNRESGCTAAVGLFGDFAPNSRVVIDGNLFMANESQSYCAYGGASVTKPFQADGVVFRRNVFQRGTTGSCGTYGAITSFDPGSPGNVWEGNVWEDGSELVSSL